MDLKVDIIVLGATGYTGKHAAKNLALLCKEIEYADIRWGIAGRSKEKLQNFLTELEELDVDIKRILIIECDITKADTVSEVTRNTRIIVNATGPNTLLSEPVVKACIQAGTHYVDISAELHALYTPLNAIPTVLDIPKKAYFPGYNKCLLHYGTWESMIHEMQNFRQYRELKKQTFPDPEPVPAELNKRFFHRHDGRFWCPYPGADQDVVQMYQHYRSESGYRPYHFKSFITMPLFIHFFIIVPVFFMFYFMCYFACLRNLLWKYPRFFTLGYVSHKGPNEEMRKGLKYSFTLTGKGWSKGVDLKSSPDKTVTVKVSGSDPGYRTTGMASVLSAITVLRERSSMPNGGVLTSGAAFNDTKLVQRLQKNGMNFHTIENKSVITHSYVEKL